MRSSRGSIYYVATYVARGVTCHLGPTSTSTDVVPGDGRAPTRSAPPTTGSPLIGAGSAGEFTEDVDAQEAREEHCAEKGRFGLVVRFDEKLLKCEVEKSCRAKREHER